MSEILLLKFKGDGKTDKLYFSSNTKVRDALNKYARDKNSSINDYIFMYGAKNHLNVSHVLDQTLKQAKIKNNGTINVSRNDDVILG